MHNWFGRRGKFVRGTIIAFALLLILLEWMARLLGGAVHWAIKQLGFTHFEEWMRGLPLWCVGPIVLAVVAGYFFLEMVQWALFGMHYYVLGALAHLLKWMIFPVMSYLWNLYGERLLIYRPVRWMYGLYMYLHVLIFDWVHRQEWYHKAMELKDRTVAASRERIAYLHRKLVQLARVLHRRRSLFARARRLNRARHR
ncbi:MAG TPA: hypothetical protein VN495_02480 [Candidatus Paceibacterota bacterium]|nr:hypothetical protein [Candidatus Paceibacterota bacterium]